MGDRAATWYVVPAATPASTCRSNECGATIYFIDSPKKNGKTIPVDCAVEAVEEGGKAGIAPTATEPGQGVSHFITCKRPGLFHTPRPPARRAKPQREMDVPHKPPTCILCGCTREHPCSIPNEELDQAAADEVMERLQLSSADEIPKIVNCVWLQLKPTPICSHPTCKAKRADLPLKMRLPAKPAAEESPVPA